LSRKSNLFIFTLFFCLLFSNCYITLDAKINDPYPLEKIEANSSWFWSNYKILSDGSTGNAYNPEIAIDSDNNIHVVWEDSTSNLAGSGADGDIFYVFFDSLTEIWQPIEVVSSESTSSSYHPDIAIDTDGNIHVAWLDISDYLGAGTDRDVFYKKKNAGGSWTITEVISTESDTLTYNDVTIDIDDYDNVYISWSDPTDILGAGSDWDIFLKFFNDTASTWSSLILISPESTASSYDSEIEVNSITGDVYFLWEDSSNLLGSGTDVDIFFRSWNIYSSTLSDLEIVNTFSTLNSYNPKLALYQNSDLHIIWGDYTEYLDSGINQDIFYRKLDTSSNTWSFPEVVSTESITNTEHPDIVVDRDGTIFVAWYDQTDYADAGSDFDIFFKFKDPFSNQWTITDVASMASGDLSHEPELALDSFGFISCVWVEDDDLYSSGFDPDICYRKFAGPPSQPILSPIFPNPSEIGNISLNWNHVQSAVDYLVYRDTSYIWSVTALEPLTTTSNEYYIDNVNETETYFYTLIAQNEYGNSPISNVEFVEIIEETEEGLFASLGVIEILIIAGGVLVLQIIGSAITYTLVKGSVQTKGKPPKRKK
jgi:hypothetical protein